EPGDGVHLAVELRAATQRLVGYGRTALSLDVEAGDELAVPVHVRRPFVYMTGGEAVATFDPTDTTGLGLHRVVDVLPAPVAAITSADGATLLVATLGASGYELYGIATADHQAIVLDPIALPQKPSDMVVSPLGRYLVIGHDGGGGGISVVDLQ